MIRPAPPTVRKGQVFKHPLGRMRIIHVSREHVTFTYADDLDGSQYPRRMDRAGFEATYRRRTL